MVEPLTQSVLIDATYPEGFNEFEVMVEFVEALLECLGIAGPSEGFNHKGSSGWTLGAAIDTHHIIVHTWPEHSHVQVDVSVSKEFDPEDVIRWMKKEGFNKGYYTLLYRGPDAPIKDLVCGFEDVD